MARERRSLIEGIKPAGEVDPAAEREFVYGAKAKADAPKPHADAKLVEAAEGKEHKARPIARVPLTTRMRADFAKALERASLERQLSGQYPNTILDILEEALEPWLRSNGYLD